jgi:cytochrome b561
MSEKQVLSLGGPVAYSVTARVLHWIVAVFVLTQVPLGIVIVNKWGGEIQEALYDLHKSIGAVLVPLIFIRVIYRLMNSPAPLPKEVPQLQQVAARATHRTLYGLLVLQPMIGWIATSAYPAPVPVFGLFNMPLIWPENRELSGQLFVVHRWLGIVIAIVAAIHIGAALYHHFVQKDRVLMRMVSGS